MGSSNSEKIKINTEAVVLSTHTMGYGVIRALGMMKIPITAVHYNKSDIGFLSRYVKSSVHSPNPVTKKKEFIEFLLELGKKKNKPLLIPANDETLVAVAEHKRELDKVYIVGCTDYETVRKFINKEETYWIAEEINIPVPKSFYIDSLEQLENIKDKFSFPILIKPSNSHLYVKKFGRKMTLVSTMAELEYHLEAAWKNNLSVMIQEYIPGEETKGYNFNSYRFSDGTIIPFTAQKIRYSDSGFGIPTCVKSCDEIPEITRYSELLLKKLNFRGFSCIEYKFDERDGKYKLMELNGRHNRSALLALKCGINFPFIEYSDLVLNQKLTFENYEKNVYWIDFLKDLETLPHRLHDKECKLKTFLKPYKEQKIFSDITLDDLLPTFKRFFDIIPVSIITIYKTLVKRLAGRQEVE